MGVPKVFYSPVLKQTILTAKAKNLQRNFKFIYHFSNEFSSKSKRRKSSISKQTSKYKQCRKIWATGKMIQNLKNWQAA